MKFPDRRFWLGGALALTLVFAAIQFVPYGRDRVNPPVASEPAWDSPATRALAKQACFDCHSNETKWPAYSQVAPISWLIQRDVSEGREALNFSEWQRSQDEADEIHEKVFEREMPPAIYQLMHTHARLSDADRDQLARGLVRTMAATK